MSYGDSHGLNFKVLSDRLEKPGIESVTPVFKVNDLSTTPQQLLNNYQITIHLRNEFHFWKVHGIMNTSGLLQETRNIYDSMNLPKIEFITYIYILLK